MHRRRKFFHLAQTPRGTFALCEMTEPCPGGGPASPIITMEIRERNCSLIGKESRTSRFYAFPVLCGADGVLCGGDGGKTRLVVVVTHKHLSADMTAA